MIALTCWACGWEGRVRTKYAGLRVTCKRCRASSWVPDEGQGEMDLSGWATREDQGLEAPARRGATRVLDPR